MIDAVLFDLDGTLADTAPDMARTVNAMRERRGLAPVPLAQVRPFVSRGARGMIMSAFALLTRNPNPTREDIVQGMNGNICRCGTYTRIIAAIETAAKMMKGGAK